MRRAISGLLLTATVTIVLAQDGIFPPDKPPLPGSLQQIPVPLPANLGDFVADQRVAIVLGKAFFWDQQSGSDGLGCASCHFHAGADNRSKNQLSPGLRNELGGRISQTFNITASNRYMKVGPPPGGGPNYTLKAADFPFHQLQNPLDRNSPVIFDTDDVVSSQGVFRRDFVSLLPAPKKQEFCNIQPTYFDVHGTFVRQAEPRNTPTVVNAIYNFRNFWDGRANNIFNGRNPFGPRDPTAGIDPLNSVMVADAYGRLSPLPVMIPDASLASQAVGPPQSNFEMSCSGRLFEQIGQKLLRLKPLAGQVVDPTDSVLGTYADKTAGLTIDYPTLIRKAFKQRFWNSSQVTADGYTQMEKNFSLFWGLAIMMYESTLVASDTPFDRYMDGDISAMTPQQVNGFLQVYSNKGGCIFCHKGAEFTGAATSLRTAKDLGAQIEHMIMGDGGVSLYDSGFYNIGVRSPVEDIGIGGLDPWGNPLSWSRQAKLAAMSTGPVTNLINVAPDLFNTFTCNFQVDACMAVDPGFRDAVDGSFKVPTLRNVELTGPYFHNGGTATLEQVVDFYNRGGDGRGTEAANTTGYKWNPTNRAPAIFPLGLTASEKANLVAFLKALTDDRVRWEQAPFDHPQLRLPNGHQINENAAIPGGPNHQALDDYIVIPAVGRAGRAAKGLPPITSFDSGLGQ
jgi:cytochrome c peroxidase